MSQAESSIPSSTAAPPPSSAPAAAPPAAPSAPTAAPVASTATPAVVAPGVPAVNDAVATATPGAQPSAAPPKSLAEVEAQYYQRLDAPEPEGAQPEATPGEAQPEPATPLETQAEEEPEAVVEPVEAAPAEEAPVEEATAPAETEDTDYKEHFLTPEEIETRFNRKLSKKEREFIGKIEAHRAELAKTVDKVGGDVGVRIAETINNVLLNVDDPTDADVDTVFDQIVLPENAGAEKFFDLMGKHLVNTQLQESTCGSCHADGNKPNAECSEHMAMGREFGSNMIAEEWGKNPDGTPFDFKGMKPIELVDLLVRAAQLTDDEGEPIINLEFLKAEVEGKGTPKPTERELQLQRENEELRKSNTATDAAKQAEAQREREQVAIQYKTQAKTVVTNHVMEEVLPLATKANWAAIKGEEGPQVEQKKVLGRLITADINSHVMASPEYAAVQKMIDDKTAFDPVTGLMTPRFVLKLKPLRTMAKARFNEAHRVLSSQFKFAAATSRNAQLVKNNGSKATAPPAAEAPPLAVAPKTPTERPLTAVEKLAEVERRYYEDVARQNAQAGVR